MFASVARAMTVFSDPAFRGVVRRSIALTLLMFAIGLVGLEALIAVLPLPQLVAKALELIAPILLLFLMAALGPMVAAFFGTLFLDRLAGEIEARDYPHDPPALPGSASKTIKAGLRLAGLVVGADVALLPLDIAVPGLGWLASLAANGWLLGREYFELAALRHMPLADADLLRRANAGPIAAGGILIAFLSVIPGLDLIAPLFGTALMVHLFKQMQRTP